jgi:hypothetical protein
LLSEGSFLAKEKAAGALQALACDHPENQTLIKESGAIAGLVELLSEGSFLTKEKAARALSELAFDHPRKQMLIRPARGASEEGAAGAGSGAGAPVGGSEVRTASVFRVSREEKSSFGERDLAMG